MRVWFEHVLGGGRDTWEGYILSQEGPTQCCQEAGFFLCRQCLSATGLQLLVWTQSTFRDWKPLPQAAEQGLHGPACQHTSQAPDEQFLPKVDLKWKEQKRENGKRGRPSLPTPSLAPYYTFTYYRVDDEDPAYPGTGVRRSWLTVTRSGGAEVAGAEAADTVLQLPPAPSQGTHLERYTCPRRMVTEHFRPVPSLCVIYRSSGTVLYVSNPVC